MKKILIVTIFLASCVGQATPGLPIETPMPASEVDLESILIQGFDLPTGMEPGQFGEDFALERILDVVPNPDRLVSQEIIRGQTRAGLVSVFIYDDFEVAGGAFQAVIDHVQTGLITWEVTQVGEMGFSDGWSREDGTTNEGDIYFLRCHAFTYIGMVGVEKLAVETYSRRLDDRLSELLCF